MVRASTSHHSKPANVNVSDDDADGLSFLVGVIDKLVSHSEHAEKTIAKHDKIKLKLNESRKEVEVLKSLSSHKCLLERDGNGGVGTSASISMKEVGKHKKAKMKLQLLKLP
ncbi:hypothetical protein L1987_48353 [Smallanthus sonchifolius]|uniref:Uncharacterized protein n=1 Tax=Smallanthus sonchifolius TaxID=185202 RepID=A0ACB9FSD2_9ASTR|nr:hypothetical protein L1987_48353 [Smallanthus sonchifolius]